MNDTPDIRYMGEGGTQHELLAAARADKITASFAERAETASRVRLAEHAGADPYEAAGERHVLHVMPTGALVVDHVEHSDTFPHHGDPVDGRPRCFAIALALVYFEYGATIPAPGRYWCDVEPDGNLSIGSRLEDVNA